MIYPKRFIVMKVTCKDSLRIRFCENCLSTRGRLFGNCSHPNSELTLIRPPRTLIAMVVASIVVADAPVYSISRDHSFVRRGWFPRKNRARVYLCLKEPENARIHE